MINFRTWPAIALLLTQLIFWSLSIEKIADVEPTYYLAVLLILAVFCLGFFGLYPFNSERKLLLDFKTSAVYILLLAWPISFINSVMKVEKALSWYPTNHSLWAVVPVFIIAAVAWFKGVRIGEK